MSQLLEIAGLQVEFITNTATVQAVRGVNLSIGRGEAVALVGESGCGKSAIAQAIMGLLPSGNGQISRGSIIFNEKDLIKLSEEEKRSIRGREIGMIFQDPMTSLNPTLSIGNQIGEVLTRHCSLTSKQVKARCIELLKTVDIPQPDFRLAQYPHEFSGGMRQRVMIAIALACNPHLLIADEPTTLLDVSVQAQIMELMKDVQEKFSASIILITHDMGIVAGLCSRVFVMYAGRIVEEGPVSVIYHDPGHPYTIGLLRLVSWEDNLEPIPGTPPELLDLPTGCAFWPRCDKAMKICSAENPPRLRISEGHYVECWLKYENCKEESPNE